MHRDHERTWGTVAAECAEHFQVVAIDRRGHGDGGRPAEYSETAARIPGGTLQVIPVGHQVHANRPAEFAAIVLGFLLA
jgi:pimeloyl-ACP methyl ester carboxylesterase